MGFVLMSLVQFATVWRVCSFVNGSITHIHMLLAGMGMLAI